jgi:SAM-dependent methyltransferase
MTRRLAPESKKEYSRRVREGFFEKYLSGANILDIGYRGEMPDAEPIIENAIGIELDYPDYDGKTLPFSDYSQDAVFASHVLEHIEDFSAVLADWYRVLKIGGYLIIAVPHRDLYERKAAPPSQFNADHKRFYTPGSLLTEIEGSLPVGGYRVRSLRDIDDDFDYSVPPGTHAVGSYEIELVVQKIPVPDYAPLLGPCLAAVDLAGVYAQLLQRAAVYRQRRHEADFAKIFGVLSSLPLPPIALLTTALHAPGREPMDSKAVERQFGEILRPLIAAAPFDDAWYRQTYPDVASAITHNPAWTAHAHYLEYGYFEGRGRGP